MYEIVNEPNLTIAFDMDTELSEFGVFGGWPGKFR